MSDALVAQPPYDPDDPSNLGWPTMFIHELALGEATPKQVCEAYGISREQFVLMCANPVFVASFNRARDEMQTHGMSVKTKAMMIADEALPVFRNMIHNPELAPTARLDAGKLIVQIADLLPKKADAAQAAGNTLSITIDMRDQTLVANH